MPKNYGKKWNDGHDHHRDHNREGLSRRGRNTSMHQGGWNENADDNYGLGDTSQGSANYGHVDDGRGSRYYGTGNYGGYFGSGSDENDNPNRRFREQRNENRRSEHFEDKNLNRGSVNRNTGGRYSERENYERGPRYGNSSIHGRNYPAGPGYQSDRDQYGSGKNSDWNENRDWWDKTTDEVSSWFGDEEAERRREMDQRYGPHHGKGPKGYTRSDEKIKEDVESKLYHDSYIDASDIEVSVQNGEVTLSGTVDHKQSRRRAEDCADSVAGVKDVTLNLRVNRTPNYGSTSGTTSGGERSAGKVSGSLSDDDKKLDQSNDLNRTQD